MNLKVNHSYCITTSMIYDNEDNFLCNIQGNKEDIDKIIKTVNKDSAVKVSKVYEGGNYGECPKCGHTGLKNGVHQYCFWCGQKLNWGEVKIEPIVVNL